jgi:hypothetical protein
LPGTNDHRRIRAWHHVALVPFSGAVALAGTGWNVSSFPHSLNVGYLRLTAPAGGSGAQLFEQVKAVFLAYVLLAPWLIASLSDAFAGWPG